VREPLCVNIADWFEQRRPEDLEVDPDGDGGIVFTVHVELCHDSCLDRPVPSISEPCDDASLDTAYSRANERGLPRIVAGPAPDEPPTWYPRLLQFFGFAAVTDPLVTEAHAAIAAAGDPLTTATTCLAWFRVLAAEDTMELAPDDGAVGWGKVAGDGCVPLAELRVHLDSDRHVVVDGDDPSTVDNHVRPSHVRTRTIQELLCPHGPVPIEGDAPPGGEEGGPGGSEEGGGAPEGGGVGGPPQILTDASIEGQTVTVRFTRPLASPTVAANAFAVSVLRTDGWHEVTVRTATLDDDGVTVRLGLTGAPRARPVRIVARGSGPTPLLGADRAPLSGVVGDPPVAHGSDGAVMIAAEDEE
jgi:hypothetical protein